jgi:hypothetical protein
MLRQTPIAGFRALRLAALAAALGSAYGLVLRPWHLHWGATEAERARSWAGDELVPAPYSRAIRAVTVRARAERVWPWIMQVGRDRGGFYSYTWLENLIGADIHNIDRLIPDLPDRRPGDTVWMAPPERFGGMGRMTVAAIIPHRAMVLVPPTDADRALRGEAASGVWSFVLDAGPDETTRLVMLSLASRPRLAELLFWEPAHFVMERKMMLTIKRLVVEQR